MLTLEEFKAILNRIRAGNETEADVAILLRSLRQTGETIQFEAEQGKFIDIAQIIDSDVHIGDIHQGPNAETLKALLQSFLSEQQKILAQQKAKRHPDERNFLRMVKAEVVDSLKQSMHHAVLMNLGKEEQPEQVERLRGVEIKVADQPNVLLPNDTKTIEVFEREDIAGRLLILGNPGSGKTTTLLELAKALIERAEMERDFPMPVLFNLSSWKDDKQPLHEWMVQELKLRGVRSDITRKWLDNHKLLPLLDGLDDMASDRQEICVKAINQQLLTGEKSLPDLIVCSRSEEYDNYETRLLLNAAVSIQALTIDKIHNYLNSVDQVELCHALDRDPELLALVRTPLFLSIAALSFQELSKERWQTLTTTEARIQYLLDSYVHQMMERSIPHNMLGKWQLPSNQQTRKWLIWLAQQMQRESQSEFLIEKMQPSMLPISKQKNYRLLVVLLVGLYGGLLVGLPVGLYGGLLVGLLFGLLGGLLLGLFGMLIGDPEFKIQSVELVKWSWENFSTQIQIHTNRRTALFNCLIWGLLFGRNSGLMVGLMVGLFWGLICVLALGLIVAPIKVQTLSNQGIRRSATNWLIFGLTSVLICGLVLGLFWGSLFGLICGLLLGGASCIQHFSLRLILYQSNAVPWNYARFLNYCTERSLLQRIGGRYQFIHRLLQEHFAAMPFDKSVNGDIV